MLLDYMPKERLVLTFGRVELAMALTVLQFIFVFTRNPTVWEMMNHLRFDLEPKKLTVQYSHFCEKCCMPINEGQKGVLLEKQWMHVVCPPLKPRKE
jgi:hypothetical protein